MQEKSHILLVDDDPDIHNFIQHELSDSVFNVVSAYTTEEAIQELGNYRFTFAIVDILLGKDESSLQLIHFLKQELAGDNQHLPMAIMSSHMGEDYAKKIKLKGPTIFATLKKPLKPKLISSVLTGGIEPAVLVIDDDPDILCLIKQELTKEQFQVFPTMSVHHATSLLKTTTFMGAIVDNKLGVDKNSEEFISFLFKFSRKLKIPMILTGKEINERIKNNDNLLIFETIPKPFKRGAFAKAMKEVRLWHERMVDTHEEGYDGYRVKEVTAILNEEVFHVKGLEESLDEFKEVVSGEKEDEEVATVVKGGEEISEDAITVHGSSDDKKHIERVSGGVGEKEEVVVVEGKRDVIKEETTFVPGKRDEAEDITVVRGYEEEKPENDKYIVKSFEDENGEETFDLGLDISQKAYDPNKRNEQGVTPAMAFCYTGDIKMVKELEREGANLKLKARNGKTCLHFAVYSKNCDLIRYLVDAKGLKVNHRDGDKKEPLFDALKTKDIKTVETLLELGARTRSKYDGKNYLIISVLLKAPDLVELFLKEGLSPNEKDYSGKSAYDYAIKLGQEEIIKLMKKYI